MPEKTQELVNIGPIAPFFIVSNLERAIRFYRDRLGFELRYLGPEGVPFFAIVGRNAVDLHLKELEADVAPQPNPSRHENAPWDAYVHVSDPDGLAAEVATRGLSPAIEDRDDGLYGFRVRDDDGYTLFFGHVKS